MPVIYKSYQHENSVNLRSAEKKTSSLVDSMQHFQLNNVEYAQIDIL